MFYVFCLITLNKANDDGHYFLSFCTTLNTVDSQTTLMSHLFSSLTADVHLQLADVIDCNYLTPCHSKKHGVLVYMY